MNNKKMTLSEIILTEKFGSPVKSGDYIELPVDHVMIHDLFAPNVIVKFQEMGFERVWNKDKVAIIFDHLIPASENHHPDLHHQALKFAEKQGITKIHKADGICHQVMVESGYLKPGDLVLGTDSHTCTYGALGVFATGVGYTEMAAILGTGKIWLKVPETLAFNLKGKLPAGVFAKDIILKIISDLKSSANYKSMEFIGESVKTLLVSERLTMSNMTVEAGAKVGLFPADSIAINYLKSHGIFSSISNNPEAQYLDVFDYNLSNLTPQIACPNQVENVVAVTELEGTLIDQAFLGSCTNGRLDDLKIAAKLLVGKKTKARLIVTPASRRVFIEAVKLGIIDILLKAGAIVTFPACGLCSGISGGLIADGEVMIASNNRNFLGRMGSKNSQTFLGSPATVIASAIRGKITDPRTFINKKQLLLRPNSKTATAYEKI